MFTLLGFDEGVKTQDPLLDLFELIDQAGHEQTDARRGGGELSQGLPQGLRGGR